MRRAGRTGAPAPVRAPTRRRLALLLAVLLAVACDTAMPRRVTMPADPEAGKVPIRLVGPGGAALVVAAHINGEGPFDLILDTGATYTCVSESLAQRLDLPQRRLGVGIGVGVGGAGQVRMVQMDSLRVGDAAVETVPACVLELTALRAIASDVEGLLGLNFLRNYHVTLDFERNVLILGPPGGTFSTE